MADTILRVRGLDMLFPISGGSLGGKRHVVRAVDSVSFDVFRGETFGIVGESGSGKTTLGRCIMRILAPSKGQVTFYPKSGGSSDLTSAGSAELRRIWRLVRMVFQDPQSSLNPRLRVIDIIGQSLQKSEGLTGRALTERVALLLEKVGLRREFMMRYPNAFSGGQRQRLGIARALATQPELVIADEAVSALDVSIQAQTLNLLQDLQDSLDLTYIFIAHDLAVVQHICDRVAVMYRGQVVELATTDELFEDPKHPYTRALLSAVPVPNPRLRKARRSVSSVGDEKASDSGCHFSDRCRHAKDLCRSTPPPPKRIGQTHVLCHFAGDI